MEISDKYAEQIMPRSNDRLGLAVLCVQLPLTKSSREAPSRRSDLESLGYCLVKWLHGSLPWSEELANPRAVTEQKEKYKADITKNPKLSSGWRAIPDAVQHYLLRVMSLDYDERPDYEELRVLLRKPLELMRASAYDPVDLRVVP